MPEASEAQESPKAEQGSSPPTGAQFEHSGEACSSS